jgi:SAM-dependent methyltransferase
VNIGGGAASVRAYYEKNTRLFLALGVGRQTLAMRRAVWADGVESVHEAVNYVNGLIAAEARSHPAAGKNAVLNVLDIGCGVGGSLLYLAGAVDGPFRGTGVTISRLQAHYARRQAAARNLSRTLSFLAADFSSVTGLPVFHLAFAIESSVHFPDPASFYAAAARALAPGGLLIVVDDFIAPDRLQRGARSGERRREHGGERRRDRRLLDAFQKGWLLPSLCTVVQAVRTAGAFGFRKVEDRNLSELLAPFPLNTRLGGFLVQAMDSLPMSWSYWRSSVGSLALAVCQRAGLVEYRYVVFEKPAA